MGFPRCAAPAEMDRNRQALPEARPGRARTRAAADEHLGAPHPRATQSGAPAIQDHQAATARPASAGPAKVAGTAATSAGDNDQTGNSQLRARAYAPAS